MNDLHPYCTFNHGRFALAYNEFLSTDTIPDRYDNILLIRGEDELAIHNGGGSGLQIPLGHIKNFLNKEILDELADNSSYVFPYPDDDIVDYYDSHRETILLPQNVTWKDVF